MTTTTLIEKKHAYDNESMENGPKKLHVGCGSTFIPGYIHVDIQPHPHVDIIHDASLLSQVFGESDVDEIYACHILEHFHRHDILQRRIHFFLLCFHKRDDIIVRSSRHPRIVWTTRIR
jgi:hypothetical protein